MSPDPVKLIGLDRLIHPGPEKQRLALPAELDDWARQRAERELARRTEIITECVREAVIGLEPGKKLDRMVFKDRCRSAWTRHYARLGVFDDYWRSVQQAGTLEEYGWKPVKEKGE